MAAFHCLRGICMALLLAGSSQAASEPNALSLAATVDAAWQRSPQARALLAKRNEIRAGQNLARSWFSGAPTLELAERNDRLTRHEGTRETELSVSAPIWLPGQRTARQSLAETAYDELHAQIASSRLSIAGAVREHLWAVAAAYEAVEEARDHQHHLQELADDVQRRAKAGDLAKTDAMLASQEVLAAQAMISAAQARLNEALSRYSVLTGSAARPQPRAEIVSTVIADPHPRLLAAQSALLLAEASRDAINASRQGNPTIGASIRRERERDAAGSSTIGVAVQIPFGTAMRNAPQEAAALTRIAEAAAELTQVEDAIRADVTLAQQQLQEAERAIDAASARSRITVEHVRLIHQAFRLGERGLADVIRARALAHEAQAAERQQRVAVSLARARLNQAKGVLP